MDHMIKNLEIQYSRYESGMKFSNFQRILMLDCEGESHFDHVFPLIKQRLNQEETLTSFELIRSRNVGIQEFYSKVRKFESNILYTM